MAGRVLVAGGAGYVGSAVARRLESDGCEVIVYDDLSSGWEAAVPGEVIRGDLRDRELLLRTVGRGFSAVVHCAGWAEDGRCDADPVGAWDACVGGTLALLAAMTAAGCGHLVYASTAAICADSAEVPATEDAPPTPAGLGARMALVVEEALATSPIRWTSLRLASVTGASADGWLGDPAGSRLVPAAIAAARTGIPVAVHGADHGTLDGTPLRDWVHIDDVADGFALATAALLDGRHRGTYNLGSGRTATVGQVLARVEALLGAPVPRVVGPRRPGEASAIVPSHERARAELGYQPTRTLDDAIRHAAAWDAKPRFGHR